MIPLTGKGREQKKEIFGQPHSFNGKWNILQSTAKMETGYTADALHWYSVLTNSWEREFYIFAALTVKNSLCNFRLNFLYSNPKLCPHVFDRDPRLIKSLPHLQSDVFEKTIENG